MPVIPSPAVCDGIYFPDGLLLVVNRKPAFMRYSIYNTVLRINSVYGLLYNALSDQYIVLKNGPLEILQTTDANALQTSSPSLYRQLLDAKAIVADDTDEVEQVRALIRSVDEDDTCFHLHINPTVDCNFRCWYCYENHVRGSKMSEDTRTAVQRLISNIVAGHHELQVFDLSFFGGEPLMYFSSVVRPLMDHLETVCQERDIVPSFQFTTNGYLLSDKMVRYFEGKNVTFQITLDGYRDHHDKTRFPAAGVGSFDRIVSHIKTLARHGHIVVLRVNYTSDILDGVDNILGEFGDLEQEARALVRVDFQRVWQDDGKSGDENAVEEQVYGLIREFRHAGFDAGCARTIDRVRCSCYGDKRNYALVNYDGNVFCCTARDFTDANRVGVLTEDGHLHFDHDEKQRRMKAKFSRPVCFHCRIAPICGGGCTQKAVELPDDGRCLYGYDEAAIDDKVLERFDYQYAVSRLCMPADEA